MEQLELMKKRHSVRQYVNKKIEEDKREKLNELTNKINKENNLNIQIIYDEPKCFKSIFAKVTRFKNCNNYICIIGKNNDKNLDIKAGYFGEQIVFLAQELGLNTCWVASTHGRTKAILKRGEREVIVIALGYGIDEGRLHKSKKISEISKKVEDIPVWYENGLNAALLAPTAINQQKFMFDLKDKVVTLKPIKGPMYLVDAGIVKYHFEIISKHEVTIKQ